MHLIFIIYIIIFSLKFQTCFKKFSMFVCFYISMLTWIYVYCVWEYFQSVLDNCSSSYHIICNHCFNKSAWIIKLGISCIRLEFKRGWFLLLFKRSKIILKHHLIHYCVHVNVGESCPSDTNSSPIFTFKSKLMGNQ